MSDIDYRKLAHAMLQNAQEQDKSITFKNVPSGTPTTFYGHGVGGLFSQAAQERPLMSALALPRQGVLSRIRFNPFNYTDPLYGIITGQTATTNTAVESTMGPCDDYPVAGLLKLCNQTSYFGLRGRMTREFNILRMGRLQDRGEHRDFQWIGDPFRTGAADATVPTIPGGISGDAAANTEVGKALFELGVAFSRDFAADVYTGNPVNNSPNGGTLYYRGLDMLINTGYRDAITGVACPRADSIVATAANDNISTNTAAAMRLYDGMRAIYRQVNIAASDMGLTPVKWTWAMHPDLFYEITEWWPIVYATSRGNAFWTTSNLQSASPDRINALRDEMRGDLYNQTGQYLLMDSQRVEVILDSAIARTSIGGGVFSSSVYLIPWTVLGGVEVLEGQHIPYGEGPMQAARAFGVPNFYGWTDNGRFAWHYKPPNNFCVQMLAVTEPRVILRTPYLAARYTNIRFTPDLVTPDWKPSGPSYIDGGQTSYNGYSPLYSTPTS